MSTPIANFGFSRNNLTVDFKNLSLNIEGTTTYAWDFGDTGTSTEKNPSHTYSGEGFFNVKLTTTTGVNSNTIEMAIGVGNITQTLNVSLLELCYYYLPSTLLTKNKELVTLIQTWQMYLQPLVEKPLVEAGDTHNELKWPALVNKMIAMIVAHEIILKEGNAFLASMANEGGSSQSINTTNTISTRQIKSIETGPTKTEWYEDTNAIANSETLKNIGASFHKAMEPGGLLEKLQQAICMLANRNDIYLPQCPKIKRNLGMQKGTTPQIGSIFNTEYNNPNWELTITF